MTGALEIRLADSLSRAQETDDSLALLCLSLGLPVSGTPSWSEGEATTLLVGALRGVLRITDSVVCNGPQEVWIMLPGCDVDGAAGAADRCAAAVEDLQPAVGIAIYPDHASQPTWLARYAEVAAGKAREHGAAFAFAGPEGDEPPGTAVIHELPAALRDRRLVPHFQPQFDLANRHIVAAEALVRWDHPERGLLLPAEFLPLARGTRLARDVDVEMLRMSARQAARWQREGRPLQIAVKLSAATLRWQGLTMALEEIADKEGADPSLLKLEVQEESVTLEPYGAHALGVAQRLGYKVCVEGFGAGPASMSTVEHMPVDELKLDSALARLARNPAQVRSLAAIVARGHALGLKVSAPHLDTDSLVRAMWGLGCDLGQGFGLAKPMPAAELEQMLPVRQLTAAVMKPVPAPTNIIHLPVRATLTRVASAAALIAAGVLAGALPVGQTTLAATVAGMVSRPATQLIGAPHPASLPGSNANGSKSGSNGGSSNGAGGGSAQQTRGGSSGSTGTGGTATGSGQTGTGGTNPGGILPTGVPNVLPTPLPTVTPLPKVSPLP